jgi:hypothetical protein
LSTNSGICSNQASDARFSASDKEKLDAPAAARLTWAVLHQLRKAAMQRFLRSAAGALGPFETWCNAVALALCWIGALCLFVSGHAALMAGGRPPLRMQAAIDAVMSPALPDRLASWGWGVLAMGFAGALVLSAAEGTWWMARRVSARHAG